MAHFKNIKTILYETIHRNAKPVAQIADETGISASYLYRAGLPVDESGVKFPLDYLLPLMKSTKNYAILKHLAQISGFLLVKVPRVKMHKGDDLELLNGYQEVTIASFRALKSFLNEPTAANYDAVAIALRQVMEESASAQKYSAKVFAGQLEMELVD